MDSAEDVAKVVGEAATIAGPTYVATAIDAPGVIKQTGTHRRVVLGEYFNPGPAVSERVRAIEQAMLGADIHAEAVADARIAIWEKFSYLAPFAAFTGATRLPIGWIWADEGPSGRLFVDAVEEVVRVAHASGITLPHDQREKIDEYVGKIPPSTRLRHS